MRGPAAVSGTKRAFATAPSVTMTSAPAAACDSSEANCDDKSRTSIVVVMLVYPINSLIGIGSLTRWTGRPSGVR